jgi:hypothetical protein
MDGKMDRVRIGCNYEKQPRWKVLLAVPLIYLHPDDKQNPIWNEKEKG